MVGDWGQRVEERTRDLDRMWRLSTDVMMVTRFDGSITAINTVLSAGVSFTSPSGFNGLTTLTMISNDGGNTGVGGPLTDTDIGTVIEVHRAQHCVHPFCAQIVRNLRSHHV